MQSMLLLADRYKELRDKKNELNSQLKSLNKELEQMERDLADMMVNEEMQSFDRQGYKFYLSTRTYASPKAERKDELFAWLKTNGYGDLVKETVHAMTLASFVKEQLEETDELPADLADLVNVYDKTGVNVRRAGR